MTETTTDVRIGNKAPDWGKSYGIRELWSEIVPGLFVGGTHDDDTVDIGRRSTRRRTWVDMHEDAEIGPDEFDAVVTMYAWARPVDWGVEELRWGIMDSPEMADADVASIYETVVWAHRRWTGGKRILVRCQAGLNRSSLIAALVLVRDGYTPREAIDKIRRQRSGRCLFNEGFERFILSTPEGIWRQ